MSNVGAELSGGLGNQLFQLATLMNFRFLHKQDIFVDAHLVGNRRGDKTSQEEVCRLLSIPEKPFSKSCHSGRHWLIKFRAEEVLKGRSLTQVIYSSDGTKPKFQLEKNLILRGEWQHPEIDVGFLDLIGGLRSGLDVCGSGEILVQIRRTDYLSPLSQNIFWNLDETYFITAIEALRSRLGNLRVHFITDDVGYVRDNLINRINDSKVCRLNGHAWRILSAHQSPAAVVISNSTFGWWIASLANTPHVIQPEKWFRDGSNPLKISKWISL